jgi:glycosyltransferase involved in cell wall biosynthesis
MRIAQIAPPFVSVPPTDYGGTERVVSTLTEELVRRGHTVTLFAPGDSRTTARLVPTVERSLWSTHDYSTDLAMVWADLLGKVARQIDEFDIIHSHIDFHAFPLARLTPCPLVTTLHNRLDLPERAPIFREFDDVPLISISKAQRRPLPWARWVATIYHGIDLDQYTFNPIAGDYLAFLGRISPDKGLDVAIRVARRAGLPLKIAARPPRSYSDDPEVQADWEYHEQVIKPLLREPGIEMVGLVGGPAKDAFLRHAAALLFPIRWPEPFGLVMPEALACGTPVLALRQGSVPEVLEDGVTGFVCDSEDELAAAVGRLDALDRASCRAEAERRFSPASMAARHERLYRRLIEQCDHRRLGPQSLPLVPLDRLTPDLADASTVMREM